MHYALYSIPEAESICSLFQYEMSLKEMREGGRGQEGVGVRKRKKERKKERKKGSNLCFYHIHDVVNCVRQCHVKFICFMASRDNP